MVVALACITNLIVVIIGMFRGGASDFTYYIARPFGIPMPMVFGFLAYLIEVAIVVWAITILTSLF